MKAKKVYRIGQLDTKTLVQMQLIWQGTDLILLITGGQSHIGSLAFSDGISPSNYTQITYPGHREDKIVQQAFEQLKGVIAGKLLVVGGIHYDAINREQIDHINHHCSVLLTEIEVDLKKL